jgi:hypothetical protein
MPAAAAAHALDHLHATGFGRGRTRPCQTRSSAAAPLPSVEMTMAAGLVEEVLLAEGLPPLLLPN